MTALIYASSIARAIEIPQREYTHSALIVQKLNKRNLYINSESSVSL